MLIQSQHDDTVIQCGAGCDGDRQSGKDHHRRQYEDIVWMTAGGAYLKLKGGNFEIGDARAQVSLARF